jgi:HAD superfamily hydrolase (TIGR01509 family)
VIIFDCNGVLIDSERIAATVASREFMRAGFALTPELIARYFTGRRPADMFAEVESASGRKLPADFAATVAGETLRAFRTELRATAHAAYALHWLRGRKCVASSSSLDRIRIALETTDLLKYFESNLFSASELPYGKPSPDIFLLAAEKMNVRPDECIVVEDSPVGVAAAAAAGMTPIGFTGASHAGPHLGDHLVASGARRVINDMRQLKSTVADLRGW